MHYRDGVDTAVKSRRGRGQFGALVLVVFVVLSCGSISNEQLQCEEAVARLEDCCPSFEPGRFTCDPNGCNGLLPSVNEPAAQCIRDRSCAQLQSSGACGRLIAISNQPYPTLVTESVQA